MTKAELVAAMTEESGLPKTQVTKALDATFQAITEALRKGEEVKVLGFGTFAVSEREAGEARNPRTGEKVQVAAGKAPKFRPGAGLREAVNAAA